MIQLVSYYRVAASKSISTRRTGRRLRTCTSGHLALLRVGSAARAWIWQGTIACARSSEVFEHLIRTVDDLQATIAELCGAIFQMRSPIGRLSDLRQWIHNAIGGLTEDRET